MNSISRDILNNEQKLKNCFRRVRCYYKFSKVLILLENGPQKYKELYTQVESIHKKSSSCIKSNYW